LKKYIVEKKLYHSVCVSGPVSMSTCLFDLFLKGNASSGCKLSCGVIPQKVYW